MTKLITLNFFLFISLYSITALAQKQDTLEANLAFEQGLALQDSMLFDSSSICFMEAENIYADVEDWEKYLDCKNERCSNFGQLQKLKEAETLAKEILQQCEKYQKAEEKSQQRGDGHYNMAKTYMIKENYKDAAEHNNKALEIWKEHDNKIKLAQCHYLAGGISLEKGAYEEALNNFTKGHQINKNHFKKNHKKIIQFDTKAGTVKYYQGEYEKALAYLTKVDTLLNTTKYQLNQAQNANFIGAVYYQKGQFNKALYYFKKALDIRIAKLGKDKIAVSESYNNIGAVFHEKGELNAAHDYYTNALDIALMYFDSTHNYVADYYNNLGLLLLEQKKSDAGVVMFKKALKIKSNSDTVHIETAKIYKNLGDAYYQKAELDTALAKHQAALKIYGKHPGAANCLNNIGQIKYEQENYNTALVYFDSARIIQEKEFGQYHPYLAYTYNNIILAYSAKEMFDKASRYCYKAKKANLMNPKYGYIDQPIDTLEIFSPKLYLKSLQLEALNYKYQYKQNENPDLLEAALQVYQQADTLIWKIYKSYIRHEDKLDFIEASTIYQDAMACQLLKYGISEDGQDLKKAFYYAEKEKANVLLQSISESNALKQAGIPDSLLIQEDTLKANIAHYQSQVKRFTDDKNDSLRMLYQNYYLFKAKQDMRRLVHKLESEHPKYYELKHQQRIVSPDTISEILDDNTILVSYTIEQQNHKNEADRNPILHIFTLTKDTIQIKNIRWDNNMNEHILAMYAEIKKPQLYKEKNRIPFIQYSNEIYNQLIAPIQEQLLGKERIVFIGAGKMHNIPFEVLLKCNEEDKQFHEMGFLIKDFEISYHCSATLFNESQSNKIKTCGSDLLAIAPVFENTTQPYIVGGKRLAANPLPATKTEVTLINKIFHNNKRSKTTILLNQDANEARLKNCLQKNYSIIHFATHSVADIDDPNFSRILCFLSNDPHEDNILYQSEIFNLKLNADLVVMSSCESGIGKLVQGEGMLGLNRGFLYAGASNIIYTLWEVNDYASAPLMVSFYENMLSDKKGYAAALRACKLKMLEGEIDASPYFWAAFVLMGQ